VFQQQVENVCQTYAAAQGNYQAGIHTVSTDEMSSIQALERLFPTKPMRPGQIEKREFEYKRHGTQTLINNLEVATGHIIAPTIDDRRTEMDFAQHVARTIATDPDAEWIFVVDQLIRICRTAWYVWWLPNVVLRTTSASKASRAFSNRWQRDWTF
jgi:hypothetical protein